MAKDLWSNGRLKTFHDRILFVGRERRAARFVWPREKDCVYSTYDGAKSRAKSLQRQLEKSSIRFPLNRCQTAIARAGGFKDWHDLQANLDSSPKVEDVTTYRRRLKAALPIACQRPVAASWEPEGDDKQAASDDIPPYFFRDVWPYVMAAEVLHRTTTDVIRPGSGAGQKLREAMVLGVLLNVHGGTQVVPVLDPDSLALDFPGTIDTVFRDEARHPRFDRELGTLTAAGVLSVIDDRDRGPMVRIEAPAGLDDEVLRHQVLHVDYAVSSAEHYDDDESSQALVRSLNDVFSSLGIDDTLKVARAIVAQHAPEYATPSGAMLEVLSELARNGQIRGFAYAFSTFTHVHPMNATFVSARAPAMIGEYLAIHHGVRSERWNEWLEQNRSWAGRVRELLEAPAQFESFIAATASAIKASDEPL